MQEGGRVLARNPLLFIPVILQLAFLYGVLLLGTIALFLYLGIVVDEGTAFTELLLAINPDTAVPMSGPAVLGVVAAGTATVETFGVALIIAGIIALMAVAGAYTKALVLGVLAEAKAGSKASIITMFRAGRQFFAPALRYYTPFAILIFVIALFGVHLQLLNAAYVLATGTALDQLTLDAIWVAVAVVLALLLRVLTLYADPIIIAGSRRPVRDSLADAFAAPKRIAVTTLIVVLALLAVVAVNYGLEAVGTGAVAAVVIVEIVGVLVFSLWRLWEAAFLVCAWPRSSP